MDTPRDANSIADTTYATVIFLNSQGVATEAPVTHLTHHQIVFALHNASVLLRTSDVLPEFRLRLRDRIAYAGRAIVRHAILSGTQLIVEATLEDAWVNREPVEAGGRALHSAFFDFIQHWERHYRIDPKFKVVVADMQTFLSDLQLWLQQLEMGVRASQPEDQTQLEKEIAHGLSPHTTTAITNFFERFEEIANRLPPEMYSPHRAFARRLLHPLLLSAPFLYRTFQKPLGYAGDYEMVNMICRDPFEGNSLFAKLINFWFLQQPPAQAHRNRLDYLGDRIAEITVRAASAGRKARILSLGCGPAHEIQRFVEEKSFSDHAHFTLLDFNDETLKQTQAQLEQLKRQHHRVTSFQTIKKSVNLILKEAARTLEHTREQHDLVYCAGLFDYLTDQMCQRLSNILYSWVQPGGLFITTNVDASNPRRFIMDFIMDWHLIYRDGKQLLDLRPDGITPEACNIKSDLTGVNIYSEIRKPERA